MLNAKIFFGNSCDTADKKFNAWSEANPTFMVVDIRYQMAAEKLWHSIFVLYTDAELED